MARLSDDDVARLIGSLEPPVGHERRTEIEPLRERLQTISSDGTVGPVLTQRLAEYLGRPVRCATGVPTAHQIDGPLYVAQLEGGRRLWLRLDPLLACAVVDAMIGGEGDALKLGYGTKVARVAAAAAGAMLGSIASALELPKPGQAVLEPDEDLHDAQAAGTLSIGSQSYQWRAGLEAPSRSAQAQERPVMPVAASEVVATQRPVAGIETALERARHKLEAMLGQPVAFEELELVTLTSPRMPQGSLRMGLASRDSGAIVLAADRKTTAALVNCALGARVIAPDDDGTLVETAAEVLLGAALGAFAENLGSTPDELHHIVRLSDDAMLADLAHHALEHRLKLGKHNGVLRWLVPVRLVRPATPAAGSTARGR